MARLLDITIVSYPESTRTLSNTRQIVGMMKYFLIFTQTFQLDKIEIISERENKCIAISIF